MSGQFADIAYIASVWILPILLAITLHEAAHGWVAWKLGDDTAYRLGRVSFNPLVHVDRFGTVLLPALLILARAPFLFGWAKPVPVDFSRLGSPRRDMVLVAAAGPGINLSLAVVSAVLLHATVLLPDTMADWTQRNLINSITINVMLAIFNMLPLLPLDGGRVLTGLLPRELAWRFARTERYGLFILLGLIFILPMLGQAAGFDLNLFAVLIGIPAHYVIGLILTAVGLA